MLSDLPLIPQVNVKELMARALEVESQHWAQDVAPQRLDGHCHSELAIDIIQVPRSVLRVHSHTACACAGRATPTCSYVGTGPCLSSPLARACSPRWPLFCSPTVTPQIVSQGQAKAENITPDLGTQMKQVLLVELSLLLRRWVCPSWHGGGVEGIPAATFLRCPPCAQVGI